MPERTEMKKSWLVVIHVGKTQLNMTDGEYRDLLKKRYGVTTARDLVPAQGADLIEHFKSLGFQPWSRKKRCTFCAPRPRRDKIPENVVYTASPQQLALIRRLRDDIRWYTVDGFKGWLKRYFGLTEIKVSTDASMVITALKGLWRSQHKCRCSLMDRRA
jgi:hypothetical protein